MATVMSNKRLAVFDLDTMQDQIVKYRVNVTLKKHPREFDDIGQRHRMLCCQRMPSAESDHEVVLGDAERGKRGSRSCGRNKRQIKGLCLQFFDQL